MQSAQGSLSVTAVIINMINIGSDEHVKEVDQSDTNVALHSGQAVSVFLYNFSNMKQPQEKKHNAGAVKGEMKTKPGDKMNT